MATKGKKKPTKPVDPRLSELIELAGAHGFVLRVRLVPNKKSRRTKKKTK